MNSQTQPPVVIAVGYSVRALVEACCQAGLESVAVDHFGDADTRKYANGRWIEFQLSERGQLSSETRQAINAAAAEFMRAGKSPLILLAGGMESLAGAVEQLREIAPLLGPTEQQRCMLRDIEFLRDVAREVGMQTPRPEFRQIKDGNFLWKPRTSSGGLKIVRSKRPGVDTESGYWQEFVQGEQIGVSCVVDGERCQILGATSSFDAAEWPGPLEFIYRGSIGPIALSAECQSQIESLCDRIQDRIAYHGWLQFDFIRDARGVMWLLECNPRWTAGMEILLFAGSVDPVRELVLNNRFATSTRFDGREHTFDCFAKAIVYATQTINLTDALIAELGQIEGLADRPYSPQLIERGHPIATVRAGLKGEHASLFEVQHRAQLLDELRQRAEEVKSCLND